MSDYIQNAKKYLKKAIEARNLKAVILLLYDMTHYAIIMDLKDLLHLVSIMRETVMHYNITLDEYEVSEDEKNLYLNRLREGLEELFILSTDNEMNTEKKIRTFNWSRKLKIELEKDLFKTRTMAKEKTKVIEDLVD